MVVEEEHAAVPERGALALERREMTIDLSTARVGKRPRPRGEAKLQPLDGNDLDVREQSYNPLISPASIRSRLKRRASAPPAQS